MYFFLFLALFIYIYIYSLPLTEIHSRTFGITEFVIVVSPKGEQHESKDIPNSKGSLLMQRYFSDVVIQVRRLNNSPFGPDFYLHLLFRYVTLMLCFC